MTEVVIANGLMTVAQVAKYLGVSTKWVYEMTALGSLPSIRLSERQIRFRHQDIDSWIAEQRA